MQKGFGAQPELQGKQVTRRKFLTLGIGGISGLIGVALGIPLVGYAVSPATTKKEQHWVELGSTSDFKPLTPTKVEFDVVRKDGWIEEQTKKSAWVVLNDAGTPVVFDPRCTHLGCAYRWDAADRRFLCPCHDAKFDLDGNVVAGPPPRPLDRLQSKIEGGKILVLEG